nr:cobyrinate a,c-diamide synthase [candidate division Zixibacteria bacterium]
MAVMTPRLVIAGLAGDSGKTIVSLSILAALSRKGLSIAAFKKGPDYIDAAWLGYMAGTPCRNLDTFMVDPDEVLGSFAAHAAGTDLALIEGNRGVFDGRDVDGTHSTAGLAELLQAPVILVVTPVKVTRTMAAMIKGCIDFAPKIRFAGVIINRAAGIRHRNIVADTIERYCHLPVLGSIPRLDSEEVFIPGRHLGLTTPSEFGFGPELTGRLTDIASNYLDLDRILEIARQAEPLESPRSVTTDSVRSVVRIGYFKDSVFTFYYPENLEALRAAGAELVAISSLDDKYLPDLDGLYIGGGFPETQAERLAANTTMLASVKNAAENGLPIYAECGGLIYLSRSITWNDNRYPMAGVFPIDLIMNRQPVGHGYSIITIDQPNPFFETGQVIRGHEFHYSEPAPDQKISESCMLVETGCGLGQGRDGLVSGNTLACYLHIHADGVKSWAPALVKKAIKYRQGRGKGIAGGFRIAI